MTETTRLLSYLDELLESARFSDYCPNGLQVSGRPVIRKLVTGVTASLALVEAAIDCGADALLVHHGYFWKGEAPVITGIKRTRLQRLLAHDINLIAYHLPLDAHPVYGNNAQLADVLGLHVSADVSIPSSASLLRIGRLPAPMSVQTLIDHVADRLQRSPIHVPGGARTTLETIAWCTGAAQNYIEAAAALGVDVYLSGEISEQTVHAAREAGIHYLAAGHHATERYGVRALGHHLADVFGLQHEFIDIPNPV